MDFREFLSQPLSTIRQWAATHERLIAVNLTWTLAVGFIVVWALAVLFIIVSLVYLFKSLGIL